MNSPEDILAVARAVVIGYVVVVAMVAAWSFRGRLPRSVRARYDEALVSFSQLPFTERWRTAVASEDIAAFVKARTRRNVLTIMLVVSVAYMPLIYGYMHLVAEVWQCHNERRESVRHQ